MTGGSISLHHQSCIICQMYHLTVNDINPWVPSIGVVLDDHSFVSITSSSDRIIISLFFPSRSSSHLASSSSSLSAFLWFLPYNWVSRTLGEVSKSFKLFGTKFFPITLLRTFRALGTKLKLHVMQSTLNTIRIENVERGKNFLIEVDQQRLDFLLEV